MTVNIAGAGAVRAVPSLSGAPAFRPAVWLSVLFLVVVLAWAIAPGLFTHESPFDTDIDAALQGPSPSHWFGTDASGRGLQVLLFDCGDNIGRRECEFGQLVRAQPNTHAIIRAAEQIDLRYAGDA